MQVMIGRAVQRLASCLGRELWAVEIKLTASPSREDVARLNKVADLIGATRRFLVSMTRTPAGNDRCLSCNLPTFLDRVRTAGP